MKLFKGYQARAEHEDIWNPEVPVEESSYYYRGTPLLHRQKLTATFPRVAELFCGCGGMSTGFEMAGFTSILGADIHIPSIETYRRNHSFASTLLGDLRSVRDDMLEEAMDGTPEVLCAGIPCQGFSLNNRKRHSEDKRNYLFMELLRFVRAMRPALVVVENVTGLKSAGNGEFAEAIESGFRDLGYGWVGHRVLNAADFGVPQMRARLFFVASLIEEPFDWPIPTHGNGTGRGFLTVADAIKDLPRLFAGQSTTKYTRQPHKDFQIRMRGCQTELWNHEAPNHPQSTIDRIDRTEPGMPMYSAFKQRIRLAWNEPSPTQVSGGIRPQFQFGHPDQPRGLTIRERCRIQSFPDSYFIEGGIVQGRVQTGNAVPPLLARALAESCLSYLHRTSLSNDAHPLAQHVGIL
ncbi:MAG: DNA cytosine methyltransferase [Fimbriimonadaceae bacterium]|nr:DNA cytosine methyltransferase [Fimbriimonadaceae bacterium]